MSATRPAKAILPGGIRLSAYLRRLIWLSLLPLQLLALWLAYDSIRDQQFDSDREAQNLASNLVISIDQYLNARINALQMLGNSPLLRDRQSWSELYQEAVGFLQSFGSHVILADADLPRQMLFNTRVPYGSPLPVLPVPNGHAAAPIALATNKPAVGDTFIGPVAKEPLVAIAVPVQQAGATRFLLLTTFDTGSFKERLERVALPEGWSLSLLDGRGDLIACRSPTALQDNRQRPHRFTAKSRHTAWSVVVEIPHRAYYGPLYRAAAALLTGLLAATVLGMLGGMFGSRRLGRAVAGLLNKSQEPVTPAIIEIEEVHRSLDQATEKIRASDERFRRLFQETPLPLAYVEGNGTITERNSRFVQVFGYTQADVPTLEEWWHQAYPDTTYQSWVMETWNAEVAHATATDSDIKPIEYRITCKDGSERVMLVSGIVIGTDFLATFFDLTERKHAEQAQLTAFEELKQARLATLNQMEDANSARHETEVALVALRESTLCFEATFEQAAVGIALVSPEGHWLRVNHKLCEMLGYSSHELLQTTFQEITHADDLYTDLTFVQRMLAKELDTYSMEKRYIRKDGTLVWINLTVALVWKADGTPDYFISVVEDIQKRIDTENSLREARRLGGLGYWKWDLRTNQHTWTEEVYRLYGRDLSLPPATYPEVQQYFTPESWLILADTVESGMQSGIPYSCDAEVIRPDGSHGWITARGEAIRDVRGDIVALHGTVQDISERRQAEEEIRRLNTTLEQRVEQRTAELQTANRELDAFAYAVSHDLRAPLRAMSGFSQALEEDFGDQLTGNALIYLRQIRQASLQMSELIDALLQLSRNTRGVLVPEQVDITRLAQLICKELALQEPERNVACIIEPGLTGWADPRMLQAVLHNLLENAWKYTARNDAAEIRLYHTEGDGMQQFCVADNGAGFDMRYADKLFQPFQRLHRQDEFTGIGIGLTTVQRIIHRHGGRITAQGEPGKGATFCFTLPFLQELL